MTLVDVLCRAEYDAAGTIELMAHVLFVCVQNAGRSQIAEAFFRRAAADHHEARSAGSAPADRVHAHVAAVLPELAHRTPHRLELADAEWADVVVTMGCGDACPYIPGKRYVDWELADPKEMTVEQVRELCAVIAERVHALVEELDAVTTA